jgi:uncharacterized protein YbbK (DUF523 family)
MKLLVSSCVLGLPTRYDGDGEFNKDEKLIDILIKKDIPFIPLCAEQLGGLETPREPTEIERGFTSKDILNGKGRVLTKEGDDLTERFLKGAYLVFDFCKKHNITHAVLAQRSPSCGYSKVYDGSFTGKLIDGKGILAQLLEDNGIIIVKDLKELKLS